MELTPGQVSGMINAAVFFISFTLGLGLVVVMVGLLRPMHTAITWSVFSRILHNSPWSYILFSDSSARRKVSPHIVMISLLSLVSTLFITIAGVATPLGLRESVVPTGMEEVPFTYEPDTSSSFGSATTPRKEFALNRQCGYWFDPPMPCPGQIEVVGGVYDVTSGLIFQNYSYLPNISIAPATIDVFKSGTAGVGDTVASPFDIQPRKYEMMTSPIIMNGKFYPQGTSGGVQYILLDNAIEAVEGLIVDTRPGLSAVGFRNHTLPQIYGNGATWEEVQIPCQFAIGSNDTGYPIHRTSNHLHEYFHKLDFSLIFDLNLTLNFTMEDEPNTVNQSTLFLTDFGGFAAIPDEPYPEYNTSNSQIDPMLQARSFKGASVHNLLLAELFNLTGPGLRVGETYQLPFSSSIVGAVLEFPFGAGGIMAEPTSLVSSISASGNGSFANPNATNKTFAIEELCQGYALIEIVDISNIVAYCGLVISAPVRTDGGDPDVLEPYARYGQSMYMCATTARARIATVSFSYNGTGGLKSLVLEKTYRNSSQEGKQPPLWAVENSGMNISDINPLWGIVGEEYISSPALQTIQRDYLYLPASQSLFSSSIGDTVASASIPGAVLISMYPTNGQTQGISPDIFNTVLDYSGLTNQALANKWKELGDSLDGIAEMINLVFVDIMTQWTVGSKSLLTANNLANDANSVLSSVAISGERIQYDILYAIPGFILLALWVAVMLAACSVGIVKRVSPNKIREQLNQTATGRVIMNFITESPSFESTVKWIETKGGTIISLGGKGEEGETGQTEPHPDVSETTPLEREKDC